MGWFLVTLATACLQSAPLPDVSVRDGNLYVTASGKATQLTSLGLDSDPVVSPDGRIVAFVRRTPGLAIETGSGDTDTNELWACKLTGVARPRKILTGHSGKYQAGKNLVLAGFFHPSFSNDGSRLYFLTSAWATAHALWSVDIKTGKRKMLVAGAMEYAVLRTGQHRGKLIVNRRSRCGDQVGDVTVCYPYVLVAPDGKEGPRIGDEHSELAKLIAAYSR